MHSPTRYLSSSSLFSRSGGGEDPGVAVLLHQGASLNANKDGEQLTLLSRQNIFIRNGAELPKGSRK